MNKLTTSSIITLLFVCCVGNVAPVYAGPFSQGKKNISLAAGAGQAFNQNYTVLAVGFDYFVMDGLSVGADIDAWFSAEPDLYKLSVKSQYVLDFDQPIKPYAGVFYRETIIDSDLLEDIASYGVRAGVYFSQGAGYYMRAGFVYEEYDNCDETIFVSCSDSYPELVLSFSL